MSQPARRSQKLLALLLGVCAAAGCAEILVRIVGAPEVALVRRGRFQLSADPRLVYEPVPHLQFHGDPTEFFEYEGTSNSLGYRDREHFEKKSAGVYRIVVLGDSIAAGYRIEHTEEAFPARLEKLLRQAGRPVEVLNFGVTGYNTEQEVETLRARALRFAPDLVLVAYCHNDRRPPDPRIIALLREAQGTRHALPADRAEQILVHSALYRFIRYGVLQAKDREEEKKAEAAGGNTVERSLHELAGLAREHNFQVLLAVFPYLPHPYDGEHAVQHDWLAGISRREGFDYLDLRPAFRDCGRPLNDLRFDRYHPTAAGHACAATAMAQEVEKLLAARRGS